MAGRGEQSQPLIYEDNADNAEAALEFTAAANVNHCIDWLLASFSAAPAAYKLATLTATIQGTEVTHKTYVNDEVAVMPFKPPIVADTNTTVTVTLAASGGAGTIGQLSVGARRF